MSVDTLAVLGGPKKFPTHLHVGRPGIGSRERFMARMSDILDRRWLTNQGRYCEELEYRLCEFLNVKHCIATCNGTIALQLAIRASGITGEAIVPSFTFVATAHALEWQGVTPVFADVSLSSHCLDPGSVERSITSRTTAIIGVHLWGNPCDVDALTDIARAHDLRLIFDAAHAIGCSYGGVKIGNFGDAEVFSFHATKVVNAFEGGCIATNDTMLAERLTRMRNFGFLDYDTVVDVGTNGKMSEPSAAMCLTNLECFAEFVSTNLAHHRRYQAGLSGLPGIAVSTPENCVETNHQYVAIEVDDKLCPLDRDTLLAVLWAEGVLARRYFYPGCHNMEPYKTHLAGKTPSLPNTDALCRRVLVLPTGAGIPTGSVDLVCDIIQEAVRQANAVRMVVSADSLVVSEEERRKRTDRLVDPMPARHLLRAA